MCLPQLVPSGLQVPNKYRRGSKSMSAVEMMKHLPVRMVGSLLPVTKDIDVITISRHRFCYSRPLASEWDRCMWPASEPAGQRVSPLASEPTGEWDRWRVRPLASEPTGSFSPNLQSLVHSALLLKTHPSSSDVTQILITWPLCDNDRFDSIISVWRHHFFQL